MFCAKCGKEVQEDWKSCPFCGAEIHKTVLETFEVGNNVPDEESKDVEMDFTIGNTKITGRFILKVLAIIAMVCFFCPLYMVSCAGQEIVSLSGLDITFGFQYMDENIEGNLMFGLLFILPFVSFFTAFAGKKALSANEKAETLKVNGYIGAACSGSMVLLARYLTLTLETNASDSGIKIAPCTALNIMCGVGLIFMVISGDLAFLAEPRMKGKEPLNSKIIAIKSVGIIIGASLALLVIVLIPFADKLRPSTVPDSFSEDKDISYSGDDRNEQIDLSQIDMEDYIGVSKADMEDLGFQDGMYQETSVEYDNNDAVNMILIEGTVNSAPSFHGVTVGMAKDEAADCLKDVYTLIDEEGQEGFIRLNEDTGEAVTCICEADKVVGIMYSVYSDIEKEEFQRNVSGKQYIFPDSDKKYLSEDEVREVETDKLLIGRNEIFARHGYIFGDEGLKQYFENTSWYTGTVQGNQFNADEVFNDFEKKNVELIKKIEDEVNGVNNQFIGLTGVYICTTPEMDGLTGKIEVLGIGDNTIQYSLGSLEMPNSLATGEAQIIDSSTALAKMSGFTFILSWTDAGNIYVTNEGEFTDMNSETIMSITDGMSYTRPTEFN